MPKNTTNGIGQKSHYSISYISNVQTFFEKLLLDFLLLLTIVMENSIHFFGPFRKGNVTRLTRCGRVLLDRWLSQWMIRANLLYRNLRAEQAVFIFESYWWIGRSIPILSIWRKLSLFFTYFFTRNTHFAGIPRCWHICSSAFLVLSLNFDFSKHLCCKN